MSTCTIHTRRQRRAERVARRTIPQQRTVAAGDARAAGPDATDRGAPTPAENSQILRRWSVAELIAAAAWRQEFA